MLKWLKDKFSTQIEENNYSDDIKILQLDEIRNHFKNVEIQQDGFKEDPEVLSFIKAQIQPNKINVFILDDVCDIVEILKEELEKSLEKVGKINDVNIIALCEQHVGFDMLGILGNHDEIPIDALITDITFGGNDRINGKKIIVDGIDILILSAMKFGKENLKYLIFTGNILSETNVKNYAFALKYEKYFKESILNHAIIKDSAINFDDANTINLFDSLVKEL